MKLRLIYPVMLLLFFGSATWAQEKPFSISGTIKNKTDGYIYLGYGSGSDSAQIQNGKFSFSGRIDGPAMARLMMDKKERGFDKYARFYIVPAKMQLSIDYNNFSESVELKGSPVQEEANILEKMQAPVMEKLKPFQEAYAKANEAYIEARKAKKDEETLKQLKEKATEAKDAMDPYYIELRQITEAYMDKYPASFVTASQMRFRLSGMKWQEAEERYNKFPENIKNSELGREIKAEIKKLKMGSPGAKAYVFSSKELRGDMLSLADFRGQYVLIDFWASWCVPCRKGNPHLLKLYSKYHDKGFEIIGISDDDSNPEAWKKAVAQDGIGVWKHILRGLKRVDGPELFDRSKDISEHFGIHTLPTKILIDPNGIIIGRYGGGGEDDAAMDEKLSEIFGG